MQENLRVLVTNKKTNVTFVVNANPYCSSIESAQRASAVDHAIRKNEWKREDCSVQSRITYTED